MDKRLIHAIMTMKTGSKEIRPVLIRPQIIAAGQQEQRSNAYSVGARSSSKAQPAVPPHGNRN